MDIKDGNNNNNKNNIDSEKGALERFEAEVKNTIFGVMFVVLKDEEISIYTAFVIAIIQFLQLIHYPFDPEVIFSSLLQKIQLRDIWSSYGIANGMKTALGFLRLAPYFESANYNIYIIIFYILVALLFFIVIDVLYVNYAYSKKKYAFSWPVLVLRIVIWLFTTALYMPITEYFMSVLKCVTNNNGEYVHYIFTEQVCWSGINFLHEIIAIFATIVFNIVALVGVLTFYECRSTSNNPNSQVNSRANFVFLVYELILIMCFNFMIGDQYQIVLLAILLIGATVIFVKFHFNLPYYNESVSKLWTTLMALNLWTSVMVVFAKIMENNLFEGSIIAWFIGIPFIILVVLTNRDHRVDLLLINVNKFQNGEEIQSQIRYILKLLFWQSQNRNAAILLDGYIEIHKQTCNQEDCPLKTKQSKNTRLTKNIMSN